MTSQKSNIIIKILKNTSVVLFVLVFIMFGILSPKFFDYKNLENIVTQASYIGIIAVGMTFVLLTGGIDLSVGSIMYLSASVGGLLIRDANFPAWLGLLICVIIGIAFGTFNAFAITKLKILPFVVTLSTMVAGRGLGLLLTQSRAVTMPVGVTSLGSTRFYGVPLPIVIFSFIVFVTYVFLNYTTIGRQIYAVGNDIEAAKKGGIKHDNIIFWVYIISGFLASLGGIISVSQIGIINAGFGSGDEFDAIAAAVLGGTSLYGGIGSVFPGTVIGTVLIQMVQAGLVYLQVDIYIQPLISAGIIFLAVFLDSIRKTQEVKLRRRNIRVDTEE